MLALHITYTGCPYAPTHGKHSLNLFRDDGSPKPGCSGRRSRPRIPQSPA